MFCLVTTTTTIIVVAMTMIMIRVMIMIVMTVVIEVHGTKCTQLINVTRLVLHDLVHTVATVAILEHVIVIIDMLIFHILFLLLLLLLFLLLLLLLMTEVVVVMMKVWRGAHHAPLGLDLHTEYGTGITTDITGSTIGIVIIVVVCMGGVVR